MTSLSIIIPHYNSVYSLQKLLKSIPETRHIQVIVVDDRSNEKIDELNTIKRKYHGRNFLFLENETNSKGAGTCRNIGLQHAIGKWILFADSDDFFVDSFYNIVREYFQSKYDVIFFSPISVEVDTGNESDRHIPFEQIIKNFLGRKDWKSEVDIRYNFHVPWSKMIRRSFILENNIAFDEVIASNDVMFSTKVGYYMQKIHASNDVIYCVTRSQGTLTMNMNENVYYARLKVFKDYYSFLKLKISTKEFKWLNLSGSWLIVSAIKYRLSFKKIFNVYLQLKKHRIKMFELKYLNPIFMLKKGVYFFVRYKHQRRYLSK